MQPYFIDKDINITSGEKALDALKKENDLQFIENGKGVVKVSNERWIKAQECEKKHWMTNGIKSGNDRNDYHFRQFDKFRTLKNFTFSSVIEIGCGPFTNARIIANKCNLKKITLLDPLIRDYLNHPFVSYDKKQLYSEYFPILGKIIRRFIPVFFKSYQKAFSKKIKIQELIDKPAEKIYDNNHFDLVIMINVLEHCYNIEEIFSNIMKISSENSLFVFEDKLYDHQKVKDELNISYDAAHPVKIDRNIIENFLSSNFEPLYKKIHTNYISLNDQKLIWDDIYFIGRILSNNIH